MLKQFFNFVTAAIIFITITILVACNNEKLADPVFNWEGENYIVTHEPIEEEELEEEIGTVISETEELPDEHGEAFKLPIGTKLFKIEGKEVSHDIDSVIAVKIDNEYTIARKISDIK